MFKINVAGYAFFMKVFLLLFACTFMSVHAVTSSVVEVYQVLTLSGTDGDHQPDGFQEPVQARVMSRPVVISGAVPEAIVEAVGAPHKIQSFGFYQQKEANVAVLCGVKILARSTPSTFVTEIDVSGIKANELVDLSAKQAIQLIVRAVEETLRSYFGDPSIKPPACRISIKGTNEDNAFLLELEKTLRF